jgi:hypothetical protein
MLPMVPGCVESHLQRNAMKMRLKAGDIAVRQPRIPRSTKVDMSSSVRPYNFFAG